MEHRYYPRMQISLNVDVFRRDKLLGHAQTEDISLGGMLLRNDRPSLKKNDVIRLRIRMNGEKQVMRCLVIHTSQQHAGVMMIDMSKDTSRAIIDFLKGHELPLKIALDRSEKQATT